MNTWIEVYKGFRLLCKPQLMHGNKYSAQLIIQSDHLSHADEMKININHTSYNSEEEAANAARLIGQQWVDKNS